MKYRKLPIVIEAVKILAPDYNAQEKGSKAFDGSPFSEMPKWLAAALNTGEISPVRPGLTDYAEWQVKTLEDGKFSEAKHIASPGDFIIKGVNNELYFCKPDIFNKTYEKV